MDQNQGFGDVSAKKHCKKTVYVHLCCIKAISQEDPFCENTGKQWGKQHLTTRTFQRIDFEPIGIHRVSQQDLAVLISIAACQKS